MRIAALITAAIASLLATSAHATESRYTLGIEGFTDLYKEDSVDLKSHSKYGSVTFDYTHLSAHYLTGADLRLSYGSENYKSPSGVIDGIPQYEGEFRLRTGWVIKVGEESGRFMPYVGAGIRHYHDDGTGEVTNLGLLAYDRHITQLYIPVGATYERKWDTWSIAPRVEVDGIFWGRVQSDFASIGVDDDVVNRQKRGLGLRADFMIGRQMNGYTIEFGPFVRYWKVPDSEIKLTRASALAGLGYIEPENTRLQTGLAVKVRY